MAYIPPQNRANSSPAKTRVLSPEEWERSRQKQAFRQVIPATEGSGLSGLILRPKKVSFATQNEGEQVFMLLRQHWSVNGGWIFSNAFYFTLPVIIYIILALFNYPLDQVLGAKLLIIMTLIFYSFLITNVVRNLSDWYYNLYLVTNERVIDYDYHPFTSSGVSETTLVSIQDVKQKSVGFLPSLFNYGDISVFSAADKNIIVFHRVPNPTVVRDKILDLAAVAAKSR